MYEDRIPRLVLVAHLWNESWGRWPRKVLKVLRDPQAAEGEPTWWLYVCFYETRANEGYLVYRTEREVRETVHELVATYGPWKLLDGEPAWLPPTADVTS